MKWVHRGLIFSTSQHLQTEFAQGPQALVFDDKTRVYFSTRSLDSTGKYVSHINYVDYQPDFSEIIKVSTTPCVTPGSLGSFDEHGIFPMSPFQWQDKLLAFTCGWSRRTSVDIDMSIGLVESFDQGDSFQRIGHGPVLSASLNEPFLIGDPYPISRGQYFELYYIFGTKWQKSPQGVPERTYRIGSLQSSSETSFKRISDGLQLIPVKSDTEAQAMPTVIVTKNEDLMFFCYRDTFDFRGGANSNSYRLGFATKKHGEIWQREDWNAPPINKNSDDLEEFMQCYPNAHIRGNTVYLLYNGDDFGRFGFNLATYTLS